MRFRTPQAVSPVVAVILMVAVTVILSAVIGTFVLNLGQSATDGAATGNTGTTISYSNGTTTVLIVTGSPDKVRLLVNGTVVNSTSNVSAGVTLSANSPPGSTVSVVAVTDGSETVVSSTTVGGADSSKTGSTATVPTTGLVAYYPLDGDANDSVGSNDGTTHGGISWVSGHDGQAARFDGTNTYISGWNPSLSGSVSVSTWVYLADNNSEQYLYNNYDGASPYFITAVNGNNKADITVNDGSYISATHSTNITTGKWHHLTWVYNNSTGEMYVSVNGNVEHVGTHSGDAPNYNDSPFVFGYDKSQAANYFHGDADDVRIYNRALNESEMQELYNATK